MSVVYSHRLFSLVILAMVSTGVASAQTAAPEKAAGGISPGASGTKEAAAQPPFIDAKAVKERFGTITPKDIEQLRGLRILVASKSLGLNLMKGFGLLAKEDPAWKLPVQRYDVEKKGGLEIVPAEAFKDPGIVHIMATRYPLHQRVQEVDDLLRKPPWKFADKVDAVVIIYSDVKPETFAEYARIMDKLKTDFPKVCLIHTTAGLNAKGSKEESNQNMHAFSELMRKAYRGKAPVYDLGAILSQDFRLGQVMVPEYTQDPTGVHPNLDAGELAMARGLALTLRDGILWQGHPKAGQVPPDTPTQGPTKTPAVQTETLPADHPEYRAVRTILDHNGLKEMRVEGQIEAKNGHVVALHIQEAGVTEIPAAIGDLPHLERLHCYGDRTLRHPFLKSISPAIGRCAELQELLINGNDLATLPVEIAGLKKVKVLSVADNCLRDLPTAVSEWARRLDPKGLERQRKP